MVLGERLIDDGAEWRSFNNDDTLYGNRDDPNRAGECLMASSRRCLFDCLSSIRQVDHDGCISLFSCSWGNIPSVTADV